MSYYQEEITVSYYQEEMCELLPRGKCNSLPRGSVSYYQEEM